MPQGDKHSLHCLLFLSKIVPSENIWIPANRPGQRLVGRRSCLLQHTSITNKSLKQRGRAEVTCFSKMVSKWNDWWLLRVMIEYILLFSLITQPVSHPCSFLCTCRHNNQPFKIWHRMLGSNLSSEGTGWLRREHSLGPTTWHSLFKQGYDQAD